jgi:predicted ATP-dependent serine protease
MKECEHCQGIIPDGQYQCPVCRNFSFGAKQVSPYGPGPDYDSLAPDYDDDEDDDEDDDDNDSGEIVLQSLENVEADEVKRIHTGPWDYVFGSNAHGDGIAYSSVNLLGGSAGAGKSTLCLTIADKIAAKRNVLYLSAEEAPEQIKDRCKRIRLKNLKRIIVYNAIKNGIAGISIEELAAPVKPRLVILDSVQAIASGEERQDRFAAELALEIKDYCSKHPCAAILINHMTKNDKLTGRTTVQHHVDATFAFTADNRGIRTLASIKNRFGQSPLRMNFRMGERGLEPITRGQ